MKKSEAIEKLISMGNLVGYDPSSPMVKSMREALYMGIHALKGRDSIAGLKGKVGGFPGKVVVFKSTESVSAHLIGRYGVVKGKDFDGRWLVEIRGKTSEIEELCWEVEEEDLEIIGCAYEEEI